MVTITISDALYQQAQRVARLTAQPVEQVIQSRLATALSEVHELPPLPVDVREELELMTRLSDDVLFTIMREQFRADKQARVDVLIPKNSHGTISDEEHAELKRLVDDGERLALRKATALKLLIARGYALTTDDLDPSTPVNALHG